MQNVRTSKELCGSYNEISKLCHEHNEPVLITDNGRDDIAVMSVSVYEQIIGETKARLELYSLIEEGLEDVRQGRVSPADEVFDRLWEQYYEDFGDEISEAETNT